MNEFKLREQLRERISRAQQRIMITSEMREHMQCEKCGAGLEWLYPGGAGDWRQSLLCERCAHVRKGVPLRRVIIPLIAMQNEISEQEAVERDVRVQEDYMASVARQLDL